MQTRKCIKTRRSRRKYKNKEVSEETIEELLDCGRHAPFGGPPIKKCQPWKFLVIRDEDTKAKLALDYEDRQFVKETPVVLAVCIEKERDPDYKTWASAGALAAENIMLAAHDLGLGSCWVATFQNHSEHKKDRKKLVDTLDISDELYLVALLTLGYPDPEEEIEKKELRNIEDISEEGKF